MSSLVAVTVRVSPEMLERNWTTYSLICVMMACMYFPLVLAESEEMVK
jgi:hypothetical protein